VDWIGTLKAYLAVGLGAALGGSLRYGVVWFTVTQLGLAGAWATAFVNITGSLLIGLFAAVSAGPRLRLPGALRLAVATGFLGGYTTFSMLSLETWKLFDAGAFLLAGLNLFGSLGLALLAVWAGDRLGALYHNTSDAGAR